MKTQTFYAVKRLVTFRDDGEHVAQTLGIFESLERAKEVRTAITGEIASSVRAANVLFAHIDYEIVPVEVTLED